MVQTSPFNFGFLQEFGVPLRRFSKGDMLMKSGDPGHDMIVVLEGQLDIRIDGATTETIGIHGIAGEMALIDNAPRSATVVAATAGEVAVIDRATFLDLVREMPAFSLFVMHALATRLRRKSGKD
ncbi:MAG: cyclic nucleotide-binding domain-containing protein [Hyphomicrobium sp.]|nr:cyclic nucleotide-binding domain-containing protein [Hyphomicrobium sp.]